MKLLRQIILLLSVKFAQASSMIAIWQHDRSNVCLLSVSVLMLSVQDLFQYLNVSFKFVSGFLYVFDIGVWLC